MPNLRLASALVSPGGVLRVNNASCNAVLGRLHAAFHSVSCSGVQRRKLLHSHYSPPFRIYNSSPAASEPAGAGKGDLSLRSSNNLRSSLLTK